MWMMTAMNDKDNGDGGGGGDGGRDGGGGGDGGGDGGGGSDHKAQAFGCVRMWRGLQPSPPQVAEAAAASR